MYPFTGTERSADVIGRERAVARLPRWVPPASFVGWLGLATWGPVAILPLTAIGLLALRCGLVPRAVQLGFAVAAVTALTASALGPVGPTGIPRWLPPEAAAVGPSDNLLTFDHLRTLHGYDPSRHVFAYASRDPETGHWMLPLRDARDGSAAPRFRSTLPVDIAGSSTYRTFLRLRHDGTNALPAMRLRVRTDAGNVGVDLTPVVGGGSHANGGSGALELEGVWTSPAGATLAWPVDVFVDVRSTTPPDRLVIERLAVQAAVGSGPPFGPPGLVAPPDDGRPAAAVAAWALRLAAAMVALVAGAAVRTWRLGGAAAIAVTVGIAAHAMFGVGQAFVGGGVRATGWSHHPNLFGHEAVVLAALAYLLGGFRHGRWAFVAAAIAVGASGSRASLVALIVLAAGSLWIESQRTSRRSPGGRSLTTAWLVAIVVLAAIGAVATLRGDGVLDAATMTERAALWRVASSAAVRYPLTGIGFGRFPAFAADHRPPDSLVRRAVHPHSLPLLVLVEVGWPAGVALATLVALVWSRSRGRRRELGLVLLAAAILNLLDATLVYTPIYVAFWATLGSGLSHDDASTIAHRPSTCGSAPGRRQHG